MSFWVFVVVLSVMLLLAALVGARRRRGGWLHGYRDADGHFRTAKHRDMVDRSLGEDRGAGPGR